MTSDVRRIWSAAAAILLIWASAGVLVSGSRGADAPPAAVADAEAEAVTDPGDAGQGPTASEVGTGAAGDTVEPGEIAALSDRLEAAETQIQLLKSVVVQALRAQSAAETALQRERAAHDAAPGSDPAGPDELMLSDQLAALTASLDGLREDVAALRAQGPAGPQPAPGAGAGGPRPGPVADEGDTDAALGAESDAFAEVEVESAAESDPGAAAADAPVVAAAVDAPADARGQIEVGQVHFDSDSADLSPGAQRKALEAAERIMAMEAAKVRVIGYADTVGEEGYNRQLSARRARSIAALLASVGLPGEMVEIVGRGEEGIPEPTADQVSEPLNRCAGIFVVMDSPK